MFSLTLPLMDIHIHNKYSLDAKGSTEEVLKEASLKNLDFIAITNHVPPDPTWINKLRREVEGLRRRYELEVLVGAEIGIKDEKGGLFVDETYLKQLDFVLAADHILPGVPYRNSDGIYFSDPAVEDYTKEEIVEKWFNSVVGAIESRRVDAVAHLGWVLVQERIVAKPEEISLEYKEEIAEKAAENSVFIEVNASAQLPDEDFLRQCLRKGAKFVLGSDAHEPALVGELDWAIKILEKIGASKEDVATLEDVLKRVARRKSSI
ncbi:MAG: hypothetical protein DRJ52_07050 [Thermoprotei archaeon]|nr:MAG: hypothetical protein DRJ52_07050 [Thermoprotei archaeon]RLE99730.1 MAG: hypothetical protein DRJ63_04530 [Thermoprotei archaeon]